MVTLFSAVVDVMTTFSAVVEMMTSFASVVLATIAFVSVNISESEIFINTIYRHVKCIIKQEGI